MTRSEWAVIAAAALIGVALLVLLIDSPLDGSWVVYALPVLPPLVALTWAMRRSGRRH